MREMLAKTKPYCVVLLKSGPKWRDPQAQKIIWEHGRRNFQLRAEGKLCIVCPVTDGSDINGICIFDTDFEEATRIVDDDPGVKAGVFAYEIHSCRSFPGDALPK